MTDDHTPSSAGDGEAASEQRIVLTHCSSEFEANARAIALRDANVDVTVLATTRSGAVDQAVAGGRPVFGLWVYPADVDRARAALRDADAAGDVLRRDDTTAEDWDDSDLPAGTAVRRRAAPLVFRIVAIIGLLLLLLTAAAMIVTVVS